jgi:hypothetical protein
MDWRDLVIDGYGRVLDMLEKALKNATREELDKQPRPDCNSMGWIVWHLSRGQDAQIAALRNSEQVWITDGWYAKFKRTQDAKDTGFGDSPEEVASFRSPQAGVLLDYYKAVIFQTQKYLKTLSAKDLDRGLDEPWFKPPPTVGVRIVSILADCLGHAGEVDYLRGLLSGKGWLGY